MAELKIASNVRVGNSFENKIRRDLLKIEEMSPKNTHLKVVLKRRENNEFESEMESIGFSKRVFARAKATNAWTAFKQSRDHLIKQIQQYSSKRRDLKIRKMRERKLALIEKQNEPIPLVSDTEIPT
ncbi:MAG: hypothetical protein KDD22_01190 [Bdellovibrionales bacterium]|nr:hypothetical protein [Bdellovibrionales bacterium]